MRTIFLFTYLFIVARPIYAQPLEHGDRTVRAESYRQKSRHEMTAATALVAGGAVLAIAGTVVFYRGSIGDPPQGENTSMENTGTVLTTAGVLCMAGSVPLYIMGARHKKKYRDLSFEYKWEAMPYTGLSGLSAMPALGMRIKL